MTAISDYIGMGSLSAVRFGIDFARVGAARAAEFGTVLSVATDGPEMRPRDIPGRPENQTAITVESDYLITTILSFI
jgi:hypothetical protein